ncbi:MAG: hypothetical protein ACHQJ6_06930, partial [Candidatus Berkiellales bacterium]
LVEEPIFTRVVIEHEQKINDRDIFILNENYKINHRFFMNREELLLKSLIKSFSKEEVVQSVKKMQRIGYLTSAWQFTVKGLSYVRDLHMNNILRFIQIHYMQRHKQPSKALISKELSINSVAVDNYLYHLKSQGWDIATGQFNDSSRMVKPK